MNPGYIGREMKQRDFAYAEVYRHPPLPVPGLAFDNVDAAIKPGIDPSLATLCKNESNCTVFFEDGMWFTTWSQGSFEGAPDVHSVFSVSRDMGRTWTSPTALPLSTKDEQAPYAVPFVVPESRRIYIFFFLWKELRPEWMRSFLYFVYSDDQGAHWSARHHIELPERAALGSWVNHPPQIMPTGEVILPVTYMPEHNVTEHWLMPAEVSVVQSDNILTETDPNKLRFTLLPQASKGIRVDVHKHRHNPALCRLVKFFNGTAPEDSAYNFQEMTVISLSEGRWLGIGRTFLGSPGYTITEDRGQTWTSVEPLCYGPEGEPIKHPMTMCPIAKTSDGRIVLLFTNNDGSQRGARHVWDRDGRTRNPQWIAVGREMPGERRNAGIVFGEPMILAGVDDSGETNLKTGISMPQFFERNGRYFVCYNINKEHILLDEIPASVLEKLTPGKI